MKIPEEILKAVSRNKLVFFIGSGFSQPLGFLDWRKLAFKAIEEFQKDFPDANLLRQCLEKNLINEILVFDALKDLDKTKIIDIIKENSNLDIDHSKLGNHRRLWDISHRIITTNYDKAIETVKPNTSIEVISHNHLFELVKSLKKDSWLFHIHGMIDNTNECIVFSENYHKLYYEKHPAVEQLKKIALDYTLLFLGFSMKDKYVAKLFDELNLIFHDTPSSNHFILLAEDEPLNNKHLKKISIESYSKIPEFLDTLIAQKETSLNSPIPVKGRYLRRRCRSFKQGSEEFNRIMIELRGEELTEDGVKQFERRINSLSGYEKIISTAAFFENSGDIEELLLILDKHSFEDDQENTRLLYLAIGYEKLDKINLAISTIDKITNKPDVNPEISLCAKFNRSICAEKIEKYDEVYFEKFINNPMILALTKERIRDKAISNHLIVCKKRGLEFKYMKEYDESVEYEFNNSAKAQSKTLINYLFYKNQSIDQKKHDEILKLGKGMDVNSRVAILCNLIRLLDKDTFNLLKDDILANVDSLCGKSNSKANKKYLFDLRRYINDKK